MLRCFGRGLKQVYCSGAADVVLCVGAGHSNGAGGALGRALNPGVRALGALKKKVRGETV